jgi:acetolactate synthase-1/3 small subunit
MKTIQEYTISVFTENKTGILSRVVSIFTRRHINIEGITSSKSSISGIHKLTIVVNVDEVMVAKLVAQIDKQVDVLKAFYYTNDQIVYQEIALYKVPTSIFSGSDQVEELVRTHNARILAIEPEYSVIEKTGHALEIENLLKDLKQIGIYEFVRSGRVAIKKPLEQLNNYLKQLEKNGKHNHY